MSLEFHQAPGHSFAQQSTDLRAFAGQQLGNLCELLREQQASSSDFARALLEPRGLSVLLPLMEPYPSPAGLAAGAGNPRPSLPSEVALPDRANLAAVVDYLLEAGGHLAGRAAHAGSWLERAQIAGYHAAVQDVLLTLGLCYEERGDPESSTLLFEACTHLWTEPSLSLPVWPAPAQLVAPFKPLAEIAAEMPESPEKLIEVAAEQTLFLWRKANELCLEMRDLYLKSRHGEAPPVQPAERIRRGDEGFIASRQAYNLQGILELHIDNPAAGELRKLLHNAKKRTERYNRESPLFLERDPISVVPAEHNRNFKRDNCEHMFFLTLHDLPTAYDFFCCTFTDTPRGYRQELHFHRHSQELTLLLAGRSDCVWYSEERQQGRTEYREIGRLTAGPLEAFRIPTQVVHTIHNPDVDNRNTTVKLTMFIDDRVGQKDWEFGAEPKRDDPVVLDPGEYSAEPWGATVRYRHGHGPMHFAYRVDVIEPEAELLSSAEHTRCFLVVAGGVAARPADGAGPARQAPAGTILRVAGGTAVKIVVLEETSMLFSVDGLSYEAFLSAPAAYPHYPSWFMKDLLWTVR